MCRHWKGPGSTSGWWSWSFRTRPRRWRGTSRISTGRYATCGRRVRRRSFCSRTACPQSLLLPDDPLQHRIAPGGPVGPGGEDLPVRRDEAVGGEELVVAGGVGDRQLRLGERHL